MTRLLTLLAVLLALTALLTVAGCSDDDENQPPRVSIVFPADGYRYDGATSLVEVEATDDGNVPLVELRLDGTVVSSLRDTSQTQLPVGRWADGLEHVLEARAHDALGLTGDSTPVTISIDPSLQTIPQVISVGPDPEAGGALEITWLAFPDATGYAWEVARTDAFTTVLASGETTDLSVNVPMDDTNLVYVRLRAERAGGFTDYSRTFRYDGTTGWRQRYPLPGRQLATAILTAPDGSLRLLSHGVINARVGIGAAAVELLAVSAAGELLAANQLLDSTFLPTSHLVDPAGNLVLAGLTTDGGPFLAAFTLDGQAIWQQAPVDLEPTALLMGPDDAIWAVGTDLRSGASGGVVLEVDPASGALTERATFALEAGRRVLAAWPRSDEGWVVAGSLPDFDDLDSGGLFARGLAGDFATSWNLRLGEADRWQLRGHGTDGDGQYVLGGIAFVSNPRSRYGFLVNFDDRGRLRWQLGETNWHLYSQIRTTEDGRWTAAGARRRYINSSSWLYDTALRGLSEAGLPLWEIQHRLGEESQAFGLAPHPDGGWYVAGFTTPDRIEYDVDLLRVDDRGELE
jgi:hypothetical protein